jgi:hypothetical protein
MRYVKATALLLCAVASTAAHAGANVTVKVINLSGETIMLSPLSKNDRNTLLKATPSPSQRLEKGQSTVFTVAPFGTDASFASVRYGTRTKACAFITTYLNTRMSGGAYVPKWNQSAKASGGAQCGGRVTSTHLGTRDWTVEFTVR